MMTEFSFLVMVSLRSASRPAQGFRLLRSITESHRGFSDNSSIKDIKKILHAEIMQQVHNFKHLTNVSAHVCVTECVCLPISYLPLRRHDKEFHHLTVRLTATGGVNFYRVGIGTRGLWGKRKPGF